MKKYILAGLLVWMPLAITVWVLSWLLGSMDSLFAVLLNLADHVLPKEAHANIERLRHVPGLSVLVLVALMFVTGIFAANMFGQWWLTLGNRVIGKIPIVKSIYSSVKQVSDTLFSSSGNAFREAVLVQYPRQDSWTIAFVTGKPGGEVAQRLGDEMLSVYVPTTPNPTSGFFLMMPRADVVALKMSVDEALKYVISMGVVAAPTTAALPEAAGAAPALPRN